MGAIARTILGSTGLLLLLGGAAGAAYVGPDDTVLLDARSVDAPAGTPVVSEPELLSYRDMVLVVRAEGAGDVLVGTGNPVDVESLVAGVPHFRLTGIDRDALHGAVRSVDDAEAPADLSAVTDWQEKSAGAGMQQVTVDLDGTPTQLLATSSGDAPLTLQFGIRLNGLFLTLMAAAVGGAALLVLALPLRRRARRHHPSEQESESGTPTADAPAVPAPNTDGPASRTARTATLLVPALVLSGCAWIPQQVEVTTPTTVAMTQDELGPTLKDYARRNNAAIEAASPPEYDATGWLEADSGPLLSQDTYSTLLDEALRSKEPGKPLTHEPVGVYSPTFTTYPVWTLATSRDSNAEDADGGNGNGDEGEDADDEVSLSVFTKESAAAPWMQRTFAPVLEADMPAATEPRPAQNGGREAEVLVDRLGAFLQGRSVPGLQVDDNAREMRREVTDPRKRGDDVRGYRVTIMPPTDSQDRMRVVAVQGGRLAVAVRHLRLTYLAKSERGLRWSPGYDRVNGQSAAGIHSEYNLVAVMSMPDDGAPRVLSTWLLNKRS